jgi:hypothetical protein
VAEHRFSIIAVNTPARGAVRRFRASMPLTGPSTAAVRLGTASGKIAHRELREPAT